MMRRASPRTHIERAALVSLLLLAGCGGGIDAESFCRQRYAIVDQLTLQYEIRTTLRDFKPGPSLTVASFFASCAFSPKGKVPAEDLQRSADALLQDGTMDAILAQYR